MESNLVVPCASMGAALSLLLGYAALITSLPFVHTARRSYRLGVLVKRSDWRPGVVSAPGRRKVR